MNSSCEGVFISDARMVFCTEGCQVVPNETSILTDACRRCDNSLRLFFGVGFSECLFAGRLRERGQQEASVFRAVVSLLHLDGKSGTKRQALLLRNGHPILAPMENSFNDTKLHPGDRQALTQRAAKCWRCLMCERMSRPCSHRPSRVPANGEHFNEKLFVNLCDLVEVRGNRYGWLVAVDRHTDYTVMAPCPSLESQAAAERWRTGRFCNIRWCVSEIVHALNQRAGGCESPSNTSVWPANEGLRRTSGPRRSRFPFERGRRGFDGTPPSKLLVRWKGLLVCC